MDDEQTRAASSTLPFINHHYSPAPPASDGLFGGVALNYQLTRRAAPETRRSWPPPPTRPPPERPSP